MRVYAQKSFYKQENVTKKEKPTWRSLLQKIKNMWD